MCTPWSGILKSDMSWVPKRSPHVHSHRRIASDAGLPERSGSESSAKFEVVPVFGYTSDPMTWVVTCDENRRPQWVADNWPQIEDSARRQAKQWAESHLVRDDGVYEVGDGETLIVVSGRATVHVAKGGDCDTYGTSAPTVHVAQGGRCYTCDESAPTVNVAEGGWCTTYGASVPKINWPK